MSNPLDLKVYPRLKRPRHGYQIDAYREQWKRERKLIESKRLNDAELAAEYYAQDGKCRHEQWIEAVRGDDDYEDWERAAASRMYEQLTALHRFATLPNYDEESK